MNQTRYAQTAYAMGLIDAARLKALIDEIDAIIKIGGAANPREWLLSRGWITPGQDAQILQAMAAPGSNPNWETVVPGTPEPNTLPAPRHGTPAPQAHAPPGAPPPPATSPAHAAAQHVYAQPQTAGTGGGSAPDETAYIAERHAAAQPRHMTEGGEFTQYQYTDATSDVVALAQAKAGEDRRTMLTFETGRSVGSTVGARNTTLSLEGQASRLNEEGPKYEVGGVLGRGGMGEVCLAVDRDVRREVAIKTLLRADDEQLRRRFVEEAQVTGQLEHPNIVPIHELGLDSNDRPFIAMKRIKGQSLADVLHAVREGHASSVLFGEATPTQGGRLRGGGRRGASTGPKRSSSTSRSRTSSGARSRSSMNAAARSSTGRRTASSQASAARQSSKSRNRGPGSESGEPQAGNGRASRTASAATPSGGEDSTKVLRKLLEIFKKTCDAVAYAHSRGVIHRDLKPENVMVGEFGEVLVMDWGLAKVLNRAEDEEEGGDDGLVMTDRLQATSYDVTLDGAVKGTPAYMPPEQALGAIDKLDQRADIYSLGAVLYEILTLEAPYEGQSALKTLAEVAKGAVVPPTQRAPHRDIPRELEAVVMKAMHKERYKRYQTVYDLKADIDAYQSGRTLMAADYSPLELLGKWAKRNKAAVVGMLCTLLALVGGAVAVVMVLLNEQQARAEAVAQERVDGQLNQIQAREDAKVRAEEDRIGELIKEADDLFKQAVAALDASATLDFDPSNPQDYYRARLPGLQTLGQAIQLHPDAPDEWRRKLAAETSDLQAAAQEAGDWALAEHIARSARFWGSIRADEASVRVAQVAAAQRVREEDDVRRLENVLRLIGEAEARAGGRGFAPGELEERARVAAATHSRDAVASSILESLAEADPDDAPLEPLQRQFLVEVLGRLGQTDGEFEGSSSADVIRERLSGDTSTMRSEELAAWIWAATRLEAAEPGTFRDFEGLLRTINAQAFGVGAVGLAVTQSRDFLEIVNGGEDLPTPVEDPSTQEDFDQLVSFEQTLERLGEWLASSAKSGPAYTRALLDRSTEDASIEIDGAPTALTARQQAFVLGQLGLYGDTTTEQNGITTVDTLRDALTAIPDEWLIGNTKPEAEAQMTRAIAGANNLARIADATSAPTILQRLETSGENSRFGRRTQLAVRLIPLDGWHPIDAEGFILRATARFARGDQAEAVRDIEAALNKDPNSSWAWDRLGEFYMKMGDYPSAEQAFTNAIQLNPENSYAYMHRAGLYHYWDQSDVANGGRKTRAPQIRADTDKMVELDPDNPKLSFGWTVRGQYFGEGLYGKAIELNEYELDPIFYIGNGNLQGGNWDGAIARYTRCIIIDPTLVMLYQRRGYCWQMKNELRKAIEDYTRAIQLQPIDPDNYLSRGNALAEHNDFAAAARDFERVTELAPNSPIIYDIWRVLGNLYNATREYGRATQAFAQSLRLCPDEETWLGVKTEWYTVMAGNAGFTRLERDAADVTDLPRATPTAPLQPGRTAGALTERDPRTPDGRYQHQLTIDATAGATLDLRVYSDQFDPLVAIFGPDGAVLAENDDIHGRETDAGITLQLPATGAYRIVITTAGQLQHGDYVLDIDLR